MKPMIRMAVLLLLAACAFAVVAANVTPVGYAEFDATGPYQLRTAEPTRGVVMPIRTNVVYLSADGGRVTFTFDGTIPTATVGHPLPDGAMVVFHQEKFAIDNLRIFVVAGTAKVTYGRN